MQGRYGPEQRWWRWLATVNRNSPLCSSPGLFSAILRVPTITQSLFQVYILYLFMRPYAFCLPSECTYMFLTGATVAIKCHTGSKKRSKWIKAVTDDFGEFEIDLPSQLHAIPNLENTCFIKPVHVPKLYRCYHTSTNVHKRIKLVSSTNGFRVYTSGKIRLQQGHSSRS